MIGTWPGNKGGLGLLLLAVFFTGLAVTFLSRHSVAVEQSSGEKQSIPIPEEKQSPDVIALALQLMPGYDGIVLIDRRNYTICIYQYAGTPTGGKLALLAARNYRYDCQLEDFNTAEPGPAAVKEQVERARKLKESHLPEPPQQD